MKSPDSPAARTTVVEALRSVEGAALLRVVRYRGHTGGSLVGGVAAGAVGAVVDAALGAEDAGAEGARDDRPRGLRVMAHDAAGTELGRFDVHPLLPGDEAEATFLREAAEAARRLGATLELWAERRLLERWPPAAWARGGGYREGARPPEWSQAREALGAAGVEVGGEGEGTTLRVEQVQKPLWWGLPLVLGLGLVGWPLTLLSLLFRDGRAFWRGMLRTTTRGSRRSWTATLDGRELRFTEDVDGEVREAHVDPRELVLVTTAPPRAFTEKAAGAPVLRWVARGEVGFGGPPPGGPDPALLATLVRCHGGDAPTG